jgi:hypothetical protein
LTEKVTVVTSEAEFDERVERAKKQLKAQRDARRQEQRELFPARPEGMCSTEEIEHWKTLLARATNHANRNAALKAVISKTIGEREKYFRKVAAGLAEAIRDKSALPLEFHLGSEWDAELEELEVQDKYHDGLRVWMQENQG